MLPKTHIKSGLNNALLLVMVGLLMITIPEVAHAWTPDAPSDPINGCIADQGEYTGFTRRIVLCIQNTALAAIYEILGRLFEHFYAALSAVLTIAVAVWGIQMAAGQRTWSARRGMVVALKAFVLVTLFGAAGHNFAYFFGITLDFLGEILSAVTGYVSVSPSLSCGAPPPTTHPELIIWDHVDCAINTLIGGVFNNAAAGINSDVSIGIGGFLLAALLSGGPGIFVALLGFLVVVQVLFAVVRALYIYILAYVSFALMALVAPIFLPMIMFRTTQGYFEKWLKLTIGFLLQPIFLFVYLTMLLAAYDEVVYTGHSSLYNTITKGRYRNCTPPTSCPTTGCSISFENGSTCPAIGTWLAGAFGLVVLPGPVPIPVPMPVYMNEKRGNISVNYDVEHVNCSADEPPSPSNPTGSSGSCTPTTNQKSGMTKTLHVAPAQGAWPTAITSSVQESVYGALNINDYFFHVNVPMDIVNWDALAQVPSASSSTPTGTTQRYLTRLFTALFMAIATTGIFLMLLEKLPFIGSGIANIGGFIGGASGAGFGFGGLAPPGAGIVDNLRKKILG